MRVAWIAVLVIAGCGGDSIKGPGGNADANNGCSAFITFDPISPVVGMSVRAIANVSGVTGLPQFNWSVSFENGSPVPFVNAQPDGSAIEFDGTMAGAYDVRLDLAMTSNLCPTAVSSVNVLDGMGSTTKYRLRTVASGAPPQEKVIAIPHGLSSFAYGGDALSPGNAITALVTTGTTPVPAYVRITPVASPDEIVEAFSDATGMLQATVGDNYQNVLVVPASSALAPRVFQIDFSTNPSQMLVVDAGTAITGTVTGPSGAGLANAQVQLTVGGVPSTLGATAADGSFTVRALTPTPNAAVAVDIDVTPPAATGLPRISATGTFDATQPFAIGYASIPTRDLVGAHVTRGGANLANAQVTLIGTVSSAATISVGGTSVTASGTIHVAATAGSTGALPSLKAPALGMSAVVQGAAGDLAVVPIDLTSAAPTTIDAPAAAVHVAPAVDDPANLPLSGITVDAVPVGVLALAGAQPVRATSDANGLVAFSLAPGGTYDFRLADPKARVAPLVQTNLDSASIPGMFAMPPATVVTGDISISGLGPAPNALVQVLCMSCGGVARTRPIVEVTTDASGHYHYAVVKLP